jgi:hypothetical protein
MRLEATSVSAQRKSLWLQLASKKQMLDLADCNDERIVVEGVFRRGIQGHWGGRPGGLEDISFIDLSARAR